MILWTGIFVRNHGPPEDLEAGFAVEVVNEDPNVPKKEGEWVWW